MINHNSEDRKDWPVTEKFYFSLPFRHFVLALLFLGAFYIRAYHIQDPPIDFAPNVQYRSAMISRHLYYKSNDSIEDWRKEMAALQAEPLGLMEPPLMEHLTSVIYRLAGKELLWFPRLLSIVFWLIGGLFLFLIVCHLFSPDAALISTAYYLFIPFGIFASRSFQPDPLMIMGTLIGLYSIIVYYKNPAKKNKYLTAALLALVILIKFINAFALLGAFVFLGIYKKGFRDFFKSIDNYILVSISLTPSFIYYFYIVLVSKTLDAGYFYPHLFFQKRFWLDWYVLAGRVVGFVPLFLAILAIFTIKNKAIKSLILGLWTGYFFYAMIFTYSTYTHQYYHLQLIPIVALTLGGLSHIFFKQLEQTSNNILSKMGIVFVLILAVFLIFRPVRWRLDNKIARNMAKTAQEIGQLVGHSTKTFFLANHYGKWLMYHGDLVGWFWPTHWDYDAYKLMGLEELTVQERFDKTYKTANNDFFIVTFFEEFDRQKELKEMLFSRFPIFSRTDQYIIFDLRKN